MKSSYFYSCLLTDQTPAAQLKWVDHGIDFQDRWENIDSLPFKITASTKLQSLRYRITHRFFPTRRSLNTRHVIDKPFCGECDEVDSLEHFLLHGKR